MKVGAVGLEASEGAPRTKRPRCLNILPVPSPTRAKLPRCSNILPVPSPQRVKRPRCSNIRRVLHPPHWRRLPNRGPPTPPSPSRPRSANETPTMFKHPPRSVPYAGETPTMFKHPPRSVPSASETPTMFKHPPGSAPTALASTSEPRSTHPSISLAPPLRERNAHDVSNIHPVPSPTRAKLPRCSNILPVPSPQRVKRPRCSNIRRLLHPPHWRRLPNRGPPTPPSPSCPRSANETPTMF